MENSFDIILENEDYTIGKTLEFIIYNKFFERTKILSFCGFKKYHPHDSESIIRIAYKDTVDISTVKGHLKEIIQDAKEIFVKMKINIISINKFFIRY